MSTPSFNICVVCGKEFRVKPSHADRRKACSKTCQSIWYKERMKGSGNPHYTQKKAVTECVICGIEFTYYPSMRPKKPNCCSVRCAAKFRSLYFVGIENHAWRGGGIGYYGPNWIAQRNAALDRDDNTCQHCGATKEQIGSLPDVHHIKPFRVCSDYLEANQLSNLISLCPSCHKRTEHKAREQYHHYDYTLPLDTPKGYVTPEYAAGYLGVTIWAIYNRIRRGQLEAENIKEQTSRIRPRFIIPIAALETAQAPRYKTVSNEQARQINALLDEGEHSMRKIAKIAGVTFAAVRKIAKQR